MNIIIWGANKMLSDKERNEIHIKLATWLRSQFSNCLSLLNTVIRLGPKASKFRNWQFNKRKQRYFMPTLWPHAGSKRSLEHQNRSMTCSFFTLSFREVDWLHDGIKVLLHEIGMPTCLQKPDPRMNYAAVPNKRQQTTPQCIYNVFCICDVF